MNLISLTPKIWTFQVACLLPLLSSLLTADDQPQWGERHTRNQVSSETGLSTTFDPATGSNIKWIANLGDETHSTPVVSQGNVLIGTNNGVPRDPNRHGDRGVLMCFQETDGAFLWQLVVPKLTYSRFWDWPGAGICSPATMEKDRAYIISNRGEVVCLDLNGMSNGNDGPFINEASHAVPAGEGLPPVTNIDADILWAFDIPKECGVRQHDSAHGSILIDGHFLYVNTSNGVDDSHIKITAPDAPSLIVLDKRSGQWVAQDNERIGPRIFHSTWSSPALTTVNGEKRILFCGGDGVVYGFQALKQDHDPDDFVNLKRTWLFDCDPNAPKEDVHRFNSNRETSPSNIKSMPVVHGSDLFLTVGGDLWWGKNEAWLQCVDLQGQGDATSTALRWSYPLNRHSMTTPAVHDGMVFVGDSGREFHCVNASTGEQYWSQSLKGEIWASALVADGNVYVGTRSGWLYVFAAAKEPVLKSSIKLDSPISGTCVAANGVLYVTTMKKLYAVATKP